MYYKPNNNNILASSEGGFLTEEQITNLNKKYNKNITKTKNQVNNNLIKEDNKKDLKESIILNNNNEINNCINQLNTIKQQDTTDIDNNNILASSEGGFLTEEQITNLNKKYNKNITKTKNQVNNNLIKEDNKKDLKESIILNNNNEINNCINQLNTIKQQDTTDIDKQILLECLKFTNKIIDLIQTKETTTKKNYIVTEDKSKYRPSNAVPFLDCDCKNSFLKKYNLTSGHFYRVLLYLKQNNIEVTKENVFKEYFKNVINKPDFVKYLFK